jgi:ABC-2 type transport system permease protein
MGRAIALVARFGYRRWANRWVSGGWRRGSQTAPSLVEDGRRRAVGARGSPGLLLLVLVGAVVFALRVLAQTVSVGIAAAPDDETLLGSAALRCVRWADDNPVGRGVESERWRAETRDPYMRRCFANDLELRRIAADPARVRRALERYDASGSNAFREAPSYMALWSDDVRPWPAIERATPAFLTLVPLVVLGLALLVVGSADARDLEDELSWLLVMPARTSSLLAAKAIVLALLKPSSWVVAAPMFLAIARMHGRDLGAYGFAALGALQVGAVGASVEMVVPFAFRRVASAATTRTVLGVLALSGTVCVVVAAVAARKPLQSLGEPPGWFAFLPGANLLPLIEGSVRGGLGVLVSALWTVGPPAAAVVVTGRLVARGLVVSEGEGSSRRKRGGDELARRRPFGGVRAGIVWKESRWLLRDRRGFMMALVGPLLIAGLQAALQPEMVGELMSSVHRATLVGFAIASYGFTFSAAGVLSSEGSALWLLYTCPRPMRRMLLDKVILWCAVGLAYLGAAFVIGIFRAKSLDEAPLDLALAAGGVVLFAFIAAGIGALGADPFAPARRAMGVGTAYLYLALAGLYGYGLAARSLYSKCTALAFFALLALALWQKVRLRIPYLLDPTARPPASLDVSDALLIVVAFSVTQFLVTLVLVPVESDQAVRFGIAFAVAGALVVVGAFGVLRRAGVSGLREATGLTAHGRWARLAAPAGAALWLGPGLGAGVHVCQRALARIAPAIPLPDADSLTVHDAGWLLASAVLLAPLFEEIIFRGFLYRSLRQTWPRWLAAMASAAAFALCHPPVAVAPIFLLGVAAALLVEWSGSLVPSMLLHATYNAVVLSSVWQRVLGR